MKFLPISDTMSVCIDAIDLVESNGVLGTKIHTDLGVFECIYPYDTLMGILEGQKEENSQVLKEISQKVGNLPVFAG